MLLKMNVMEIIPKFLTLQGKTQSPFSHTTLAEHVQSLFSPLFQAQLISSVCLVHQQLLPPSLFLFPLMLNCSVSKLKLSTVILHQVCVHRVCVRHHGKLIIS